MPDRKKQPRRRRQLTTRQKVEKLKKLSPAELAKVMEGVDIPSAASDSDAGEPTPLFKPVGLPPSLQFQRPQVQQPSNNPSEGHRDGLHIEDRTDSSSESLPDLMRQVLDELREITEMLRDLMEVD